MKIKPCPFCGCEASIKDVQENKSNEIIMATVGCYKTDCGVSITTPTVTEAICIWNTRRKPKTEERDDV